MTRVDLKGLSADELPDSVRFALRAAIRCQLSFEIIDPYSGYLAEVSNRNHAILVGAGSTSAYACNNTASSDAAMDKTHSYSLLARVGARVPVSEPFFLSDRYSALRPTGRGPREALLFAEKLGYPIFCKPNDGSRGAFAEQIDCSERLSNLLTRMVEGRHLIALIQELVEGQEERVIVVDGSPRLGYRKTPAHLVGDGRSSISALLAEWNTRLATLGVTPVDSEDAVLVQALRAKKLSLKDTLPLGESLPAGARANIAAGGKLGASRTQFSEVEHRFCRRVSHALRLSVFALDIITPQDATSCSDGCIIEVNSNPNLSPLIKLGHEELLDTLWSEILDLGFRTSSMP